MFQRFQTLFKQKPSTPLPKAPQKSDRYVLVLSGGGTRGFYTLGILKAMEEYDMKRKIDAIYGISVWAIIAAYRSAGWTAQAMFNQYSKLKITPGQWLKFLPTTSFLKTQSLQTFFKRDLPQNFEELHIPVYIGATNMNTAELMVFHKGELLSPLLGSIAIPGIFPSVKYQKHLLNDGGIVDNFPTQLAQTTYPNHKIIGVALNKFRENKNPTNLISTFLTAYAIVMRKDLVKKSKEIEVAFYEDIDCWILELNKKKRTRAFEQGYISGKKAFGKLK